MTRREQGRPSNLEGAMTTIRSSALLSDAFAFDEMEKVTILKRPLPVQGTEQVGNAEDLPRAIRDTDVSQVQEFLQRQGLSKLTKGTVHDAVDLRAAEMAFHPVRDYLGSLQWDGVARLDGWLSDYLRAEDNAYSRGIGPMILVAMVARIFEPGCKADYLPVLEGRQGARKSTACKILGGAWFSDSLPDVNESKEVAQHLRNKWLVEIAELSAMGRAETELLKAFISRSVERYRPSYGRREVIEPRNVLFIGTTNRSTYLKDETGGRRFWPVKVGDIHIDRLSADRDRLFAEAVVRYRAGYQWWPDAAFEAAQIVPEQDQRFEVDVWEEAIATFLLSRSKTTVSEVAKEALFIETKSVSTTETRRITSCLERLNWNRGKKDRTGRIRWERLCAIYDG